MGGKNAAAKNNKVAYSQGKASIVAQHIPNYAYTPSHVGGRLPGHLNIMSSSNVFLYTSLSSSLQHLIISRGCNRYQDSAITTRPKCELRGGNEVTGRGKENTSHVRQIPIVSRKMSSYTGCWMWLGQLFIFILEGKFSIEKEVVHL